MLLCCVATFDVVQCLRVWSGSNQECLHMHACSGWLLTVLLSSRPAQDPNVQFWTWHEARALPEGSCASLWPVTPSPPPSPPTGGSATSAQSSSSSNIGAIVGGVVGGCVALALFVLLGVLLWRRRSASTLHDEELIHKSYYTGTSDTYSTGFRSYQGKEVLSIPSSLLYVKVLWSLWHQQSEHSCSES